MLTYMGGKRRMAPWIHSFIPKGVETYVEVFGGAFWVYMKSDPDNPLATKQHIYNDFNPYMVNLIGVPLIPNNLISLLMRRILHYNRGRIKDLLKNVVISFTIVRRICLRLHLLFKPCVNF